ncbi:hypothetical protein OM076_06950 [Solirubrobacter ginsenosidimutans]|uniref:Calcium-binding protein n=1 Tax=Solirubrobacter ginsenosidimutans TaxID=490573 RepID=A0A9X3S0E8_9ACTN|nr:calcium-binding protein [Solirubrobacter ginsenosidimutans]MDA0159992.1 hypothetical protein [Solirubrobacter ginsenosidimutans]
MAFAAACACLALAAPATAIGSTVELETAYTEGEETYDGEAYTDVTIAAARGERNRLSVTVNDRELIVRDAGAPVRSGSPTCRSPSPQLVRCRLSRDPVVVTIRAGDGPDRIVVAGTPSWVELYGGDGPDELRAPAGLQGVLLDGGPGDDRLVGGPGEDSLFGGAGDDHLSGGAGQDELYDDEDAHSGRHRNHTPAGSDTLDGGPGRDRVSYRAHRRAMRVDLRGGRATGRGERDVLRGIEDAQGGSGADRVIGDDGANALDGMAGADRLDGRGGDDELQGGGDVWSEPSFSSGVFGSPVPTTAGDHLAGGDGNDTLVSQGHASSGGTGTDTCAGGGTRRQPQRLPGCEWWIPSRHSSDGPRISTELVADGGELSVTGIGVIALTVSLARDPTVVLAEGTVTAPPDHAASMPLPLTPAGVQAMAAQPPPFDVLVSFPQLGSAILTLR